MHSYNSLYIYFLLLKGTIHPFAPQKSMIKSFGREFRSVLRLKQVIYSAWLNSWNMCGLKKIIQVPSTVFLLLYLSYFCMKIDSDLSLCWYYIDFCFLFQSKKIFLFLGLNVLGTIILFIWCHATNSMGKFLLL